MINILYNLIQGDKKSKQIFSTFFIQIKKRESLFVARLTHRGPRIAYRNQDKQPAEPTLRICLYPYKVSLETLHEYAFTYSNWPTDALFLNYDLEIS